MTGRLVLRADATPAIGAGHAMRLLTLGAAWGKLGGEVVLVGEVAIPFVERRIAALGIEHRNPPSPPGSVLVADTYDPMIRFRCGDVAGYDIRVLVDDIGGEMPPGVDVVWNPNPYGAAALYAGFSGGILTGPDVVPIREGLPRWDPAAAGDETFVSLGGGTPPAGIRDAIEQLAELMPAEAFAIVGDWAPRGWRSVPSVELWEEAGRARRLVTAAGTTTWEAAFVGVPVILLQVADNQRLAYRWGRDAGVPGLNAGLVDAEFLAHQLRALLAAARPLPRLEGGAGHVAECLAQLGGQAR